MHYFINESAFLRYVTPVFEQASLGDTSPLVIEALSIVSLGHNAKLLIDYDNDLKSWHLRVENVGDCMSLSRIEGDSGRPLCLITPTRHSRAIGRLYDVNGNGGYVFTTPAYCEALITMAFRNELISLDTTDEVTPYPCDFDADQFLKIINQPGS